MRLVLYYHLNGAGQTLPGDVASRATRAVVAIP